MRVSNSLSIPEQLERARLADSLVVFAGAGVSMGAPANLPDFKSLARHVAEAKVPWDDERWRRALDKYLGKAEQEQVKVQERARLRLSQPSQHTPLHEGLLGIFVKAENVRLISTNFDTLFSSAASTVFRGQQPRTYIGPTLPPGQQFRGIAQIHGSLTEPHDRLVLTDADFGFAYMADGWATRFLVGALRESTVLFVGYSLGDPVLQYLVRALPLKGRSFALCKREDEQTWKDHGIEPVVFADAPGQNKYADLHDGIGAWAEYARSTASDHDERMRRQLAAGIPQSETDSDYIRTRLTTDAGRASFLRYARAPEWLEWVSSFGFLDELLKRGQMSPEAQLWAYWIADHFSLGDQPPVLRWLRHQHLPTSEALRTAIALALFRCQQLPDPTVLRQLIAVLVSEESPDLNRGPYTVYLLGRLVKEGRWEESIALLRWITQVRLLPAERYHGLERDEASELPALSHKIGLYVDDRELNHIIDREGGQLVVAAPSQVLSIATRRIEDAYSLLALAQREGSEYDPLSSARTAIAETGQDRFRHGEDILIVLARDALVALQETDSPKVERFLAENLTATAPALLRRLALHHLSVLPEARSNEVLTRLRSLDWLLDFWVRPELFACIRAHFSHSDAEVQSALIAHLASLSPAAGEAEGRKRLAALLVHLSPENVAARRFAIDSSIDVTKLGDVDTEGFLSRFEMGTGGDLPSPVDSSEIAGWKPAALTTRVQALIQSSEDLRAYTQPLLGAVQQAAQDNPDWGVEALYVLAPSTSTGNHDLEERLAEAIAWGLHSALPSDNATRRFLPLLGSGKWPARLLQALAFAAESWSRRLTKSTRPEDLALYLSAADALFDQSASVPQPVDDGDWYTKAINHPAGKAAEIWLRVATLSNWADGVFTPHADAAEISRWEKVLSTATLQAAFARPILGSATERFIAADLPFARSRLLPAFAPENGVSAAQLWSGRLIARNWSEESLNRLCPMLASLFLQRESIVADRDEQIGDLAAFVVSKHPNSPLDSVALLHFADSASEQTLAAFSRQLSFHLEPLTVTQRQIVWDEIIQPYWRDRRTGSPRALLPVELSNLLRMVFILDGREKQLLQEADLSAGFSAEQTDGLVHELSEAGTWTASHPGEALRLLTIAAKAGAIPQWASDDACKIIEAARAAGASRDLALDTAEVIAASTGSHCAISIAQRLKSSPPQE